MCWQTIAHQTFFCLEWSLNQWRRWGLSFHSWPEFQACVSKLICVVKSHLNFLHSWPSSKTSPCSIELKCQIGRNSYFFLILVNFVEDSKENLFPIITYKFHKQYFHSLHYSQQFKDEPLNNVKPIHIVNLAIRRGSEPLGYTSL